jgi:hypothetical protein
MVRSPLTLEVEMKRRLTRLILALVALGLAYPAVASAAELAAKAAHACGACPLGCC